MKNDIVETRWITEEELSKSKARQITNRNLIEHFDDYNFNAIYQRETGIWTSKMKEDLLISIVCDIPCGYIHTVEHKNKRDFWSICDGIQRWSVVKEFVRGSGKIRLIWQEKKLSFQDLKKSENGDLYRRFMSYSWDVREWPPMSILKQRDLFQRINAGSGLTNDERMYCSDFFTKSLLMWMHSQVINSLGEKITIPVFENKRYKTLTWCHDLLFTCFGPDGKGIYHEKNPSHSKRIESSKTLNEMFLKYFGEDEMNKEDEIDVHNIITPEVIKGIGLECDMNLLIKTFEVVGLVFDYSSMLKKKIDKNALKDIIIWTLNHLRDKNLSYNQVVENRRWFFKIFKTFIENRSLEGLTQKQSNATTRFNTFIYIDNLCAMFKINLEKKYKPLTKSQKDQALANCDGKCPKCKAQLHNDNIHFDHLKCKSKHSSTIGICLCSHCNVKKSDWTSKELAEYQSLIERYESNNHTVLGKESLDTVLSGF